MVTHIRKWSLNTLNQTQWAECLPLIAEVPLLLINEVLKRVWNWTLPIYEYLKEKTTNENTIPFLKHIDLEHPSFFRIIHSHLPILVQGANLKTIIKFNNLGNCKHQSKSLWKKLSRVKFKSVNEPEFLVKECGEMWNMYQ